MNKNILIASSTLDEATYGPVAEKVTGLGHDVIIFEADKVATGATHFDIKLDNESGVTIAYRDEELALSAIGAAWYRRADHLYGTNNTRFLALDSERATLQHGLWNVIPDTRWLNAPKNIPAASKKLTQLDAATKLGFRIPETVIANHWQPIVDGLPETIVYKACSPLFFDEQNVLTLFTTPFDNGLENLPTSKNPYPGIWQGKLAKLREWRITVVGEETFDASIYTDESAKDDWRKHQLTPGQVDFRKERFPDDLRERCIKYLGIFGLRFGAFDFIENPDGKIIFLECNPNGQFMWLEHQLGLPISDAIASELIKIASSSGDL